MPTVRTIAKDASERKLLDDIAKYGWHGIHILAEGDQGPYLFTVGLFNTYQHPELLVYGLKREVAHQVIWNAVGGLPKGERLDLDKPTDELLEGYSCCFVEVPKATYYEYVGFARWYYYGNDFPLYQIVRPSRDGHFPWHAMASEEFRRIQPVLGHARLGI